MTDFVGGFGPSNAKIVIVGEMPSSDDLRSGTPFNGTIGRLIDNLLEKAGISPKEVYKTNVSKRFLPFHKHIDIQECRPQLFEEIRQIDPNVVLAFGGTALETLTGMKGIEKYRGSILPSLQSSHKVVSTISPGSLYKRDSDGKMRSWKDLTYIQWDVNRAALQSRNKLYEPPRRSLTVIRNSHQLYRYLESNRDKRFCSLDIETFRTIPICIGIAFSGTSAVSVPFFNALSTTNETGMSRSEIVDCWNMVSELLANPNILKIGQNFRPFDVRQLSHSRAGTTFFGMKVNGIFFDTQLAFRVLYPELPAKLQFIASVLTEEPYWKDEGKEYNPKKDKFDRLLLYNAKDAAVTYECFEKEMEELEQKKLTHFYFTYQAPLDEFYSRIEMRGILGDPIAKKELYYKYTDLVNELQAELNDLTKEWIETPINVNSNSSKGLVPELVYGLMKCPIRKGVGEIELSGLLRNTVKDEKKKRILGLILILRKVKKVISSNINANVDHRGRYLTTFRRALETGRTSTALLKPPLTEDKKLQLGMAFQTITKHGDVGVLLAEMFPLCKDIGSDVRRLYIPDQGHVFIEADLSQAEARVVALLARDEKMLKMFQYKVDLHRVTCAWIDDITVPNLEEFFNCTSEIDNWKYAKEINDYLKPLIDDDKRQMGKKFRHAAHYAMGKATAATQIGLPEWKAGQILTKVHKTNPNIQGVFHREIIDALGSNQRTLVSPNGRTRQFLNKWGEELWKEAYAQIPQSTVSDQTKAAMMQIEKRSKIRMLSESHDSFLGQIPLAIGEQFPFKWLDASIPVVREEMEKPIDFVNCTLPRGAISIPCSMSISEESWYSMKEIA